MKKCCEKCARTIPVSSTYGGTQTYCKNPDCPCHQEKKCCPKCEIHLPYKEKNEYQCNDALCECHQPQQVPLKTGLMGNIVEKEDGVYLEKPQQEGWEKALDKIIERCDDGHGSYSPDWDEVKQLFRLTLSSDRASLVKAVEAMRQYIEKKDLYNLRGEVDNEVLSTAGWNAALDEVLKLLKK